MIRLSVRRPMSPPLGHTRVAALDGSSGSGRVLEHSCANELPQISRFEREIPGASSSQV